MWIFTVVIFLNQILVLSERLHISDFFGRVGHSEVSNYTLKYAPDRPDRILS
jgi:hypothetical protein